MLNGVYCVIRYPSVFGLIASIALFVCSFFSGAATYADVDEEATDAMMEAGVMLVGQLAGDYRGSNYYNERLLPLPYFYYQGPVIKAGKGGIRGEFWAGERLQFNVSLDGALGGENSDRNARRGMPELETAVEIGPSLDILLAGKSFSDGVTLRLPVRAVFSLSGDGIDHIGNLINPRVNWRIPGPNPAFRVSLQAGILFADSRYHNHYYGVQAPFVETWRPQYKADSGYSGAYLRANFYRSWGDWRAGVSLRYDNLSGAAFRDSPLVQTKHFGSISFVVIRRLWGN